MPFGPSGSARVFEPTRLSSVAQARCLPLATRDRAWQSQGFLQGVGLHPTLHGGGHRARGEGHQPGGGREAAGASPGLPAPLPSARQGPSLERRVATPGPNLRTGAGPASHPAHRLGRRTRADRESLRAAGITAPSPHPDEGPRLLCRKDVVHAELITGCTPSVPSL